MKKLYAFCPRCNKCKLFMTEYNCPEAIMKVRNWIVCKNCDYAIQIENFKKILYCA